MWYLYITENLNGAYYTGITTNVERRFKEHLIGRGGQYTSRNRPQQLVYTETFPTRIQAERREQQIKHWSRAKKKALIEGDADKLRKLSISRDHLTK
jgi:predicted GIY-YIG superfamily endonuclease